MIFLLNLMFLKHPFVHAELNAGDKVLCEALCYQAMRLPDDPTALSIYGDTIAVPDRADKLGKLLIIDARGRVMRITDDSSCRFDNDPKAKMKIMQGELDRVAETRARLILTPNPTNKRRLQQIDENLRDKLECCSKIGFQVPSSLRAVDTSREGAGTSR